MRFFVNQDCDYVIGHLRYGHLEGEVNVESEEELQKLIDSGEIRDYMELEIDDFSVDSYEIGNNKVNFEKVLDK